MTQTALESNARPIPSLKHARPQNDENKQNKIEGICRLDSRNVRLQVEWDGLGPGRMSVEVAEGQWRRLTHIHTQSPNSPGTLSRLNDVLLIKKETKDTCKTFKVTFQRGGKHPRSQFHVWAIPVRWTETAANLTESECKNFVAERGKHYKCDKGPCTKSGSKLENGAQCATLELKSGCSYELWASLQDPHDENRWHKLDPIVDDGPGNGGGSNPRWRRY